MRFIVAAVGRLKDEADRTLFDKYAARLKASGRAQSLGPLDEIELSESRAATAELRKSDEAKRLLKATESADLKIVLDASGKQMTSEAFAAWLGQRRDAGTKTVALLIGGPDGHGAETIAAAQLTLSLGTMTLPHGLARVVIAEQLYRAATILAGHPYHRG